MRNKFPVFSYVPAGFADKIKEGCFEGCFDTRTVNSSLSAERRSPKDGAGPADKLPEENAICGFGGRTPPRFERT